VPLVALPLKCFCSGRAYNEESPPAGASDLSPEFWSRFLQNFSNDQRVDLMQSRIALEHLNILLYISQDPLDTKGSEIDPTRVILGISSWLPELEEGIGQEILLCR